MFSQVWKKYLPVIIILLKRSVHGEQILSMNNTDFERAAGGRKIKFTFNRLQLNNARINNDEKHTPFARELATILLEDVFTGKFLRDQHIEFSLNKEFKLLIRNTTPAVAPVEEVIPEEDTVAII